MLQVKEKRILWDMNLSNVAGNFNESKADIKL